MGIITITANIFTFLVLFFLTFWVFREERFTVIRSFVRLRTVLIFALFVLYLLVYLAWILNGASGGTLYLFFNNIWLTSVTFIPIFGLLYLLVRMWSRVVAFKHRGLIYLSAWLIALPVSYIGHLNTSRPVLTRYEFSLDKIESTSHPDTVRVLFVSDLHIGPIIGANEITHLSEQVASLDPDYLILGGDMIDRKIDYVYSPDVSSAFNRLCTESVPEGHTFFILGNHEYYADTREKLLWIKEHGQLLRDSVVRTREGIYLVGRDSGIGNVKRASMQALLTKVPKESPIVLLAHEPEERGEEQVTDRPFLALHGHTHNGQHILLSPLVFLKYPHIYGLKKKGEATHIISSGYGVSTSTIRVGTKSEIVVIDLVL